MAIEYNGFVINQVTVCGKTQWQVQIEENYSDSPEEAKDFVDNYWAGFNRELEAVEANVRINHGPDGLELVNLDLDRAMFRPKRKISKYRKIEL